MINPITIRKGSKVYFADTKDEPVTVFDNVNGQISVKLNKMIYTNAEALFPVPLTPALIMRCGFIKTDEFVFEYPGEDLELEYDYQGITHMHLHKNHSTLQVSALHELQHAFWVYTNKELLFK